MNHEVQHLESLYPAETREKEMGEIFNSIKQGKSLQLMSLPGAGKATILGFLAYNRNIRIHHLGEGQQLLYHFVLINFSEIKNRPLFDVMKFLFLELASSLHERRREEEFLIVDKLFKDALSYQDEMVLFQGLKDAIDYVTLEKGIALTFLFDRFETFIPQATEAFFTNLRSIRSRAKYKFSIIFSTNRPLEDVLEPNLISDFYEFISGNYVFLTLPDLVGLEFRVSYLEKLTNKKIPQDVIDKIVHFTAGHGKLTKLALEATVSSQQNPENDNLETFLLSQKAIQGSLLEIWHFLTPDEKQDIMHLATDESCPNPNVFLQQIHLLDEDAIAIPLFTTYVQNQIKLLPKKIVFIYDDATNTIQRSGAVISDILTKSEFVLLKLLLEKPDTVIDRETVIATVWSDSKTQEGVSEQAIDQLIFRLRKKIEDDPTHPTHIETVKGRGVKFIQ